MKWIAPFTLRAGANPRFDILAYTGGQLNVGGFEFPVIVDLAGLELPASVPLVAGHETDNLASDLGDGVPMLDGSSIRFAGSIYPINATAQEVVAKAKAGKQWQASIGATVHEQELVPEGQSVQVNGREFSGPVIVARSAILREVSIVVNGADPYTQVTIAANAAQQRKLKGAAMSFDEWVMSLGMDPATLSDAAKSALMVSYESTMSSDAAPDVPAQAATDPEKPDEMAAKAQASIDRARQLQAAEMRRIDAINAVAAGHAKIAATAIEKGWSSERTELEVLKASRPKAPAAHIPTHETGGKVLEAAICQMGKLAATEKLYDDKTLTAADRLRRDGMGLQRVLLEAAWANGFDGRFVTQGNVRAVLEHAFPRGRSLQAGFTTLSLPGIFSNVANKFLLEGYTAVEDTWRQIAAVRSVNDFKAVTSYRLNASMQFEEVGPTGELKHGTFGEESFTNQVRTYGKMGGLTRQDIINDDLGALTDAPRQLGRGGGLKLNTVFWTAFLDNSTFFTSGRGNYEEGAGTALSIDALTAAELLFLNQTDPNGNPMGITPKFLLVPNALNVKASQFTRDTEIRDTTASTKYSISNPHAGKFTPIRSSYLSNTAISGYSVKAWYLLADPAEVPVIEVAFLDGVESPTVEDADADFDVLGVQLRGYFDFGVAKQDYRGGVKEKGEA